MWCATYLLNRSLLPSLTHNVMTIEECENYTLHYHTVTNVSIKE